MKLLIGTEIYYEGDMANRGGFGTITEIGDIGYGSFINVKMDDGREFKQLPVTGFSEKYLGHGGTRFVTKEAYREWRKEMVQKFRGGLKR